MNKLKQLSTASALGFGLAVTLASILMVIISSVLANRAPAGSQEWYVAGTIGRVVSILLLVALLARLGWLHAAGLTRPGR